MSKQSKKKVAGGGGPASRLGLMLRDAVIEAWVLANPHHQDEAFDGVKLIGQVGFDYVAACLLKKDVTLPAGDGAEGNDP